MKRKKGLNRRRVLFWLKFFLLLFFCFHLALFLAAAGPVYRLRIANPRITSLMRLRSRQSRAPQQPPAFLALREIPLNLVRCVVHIEDSRFFQHRGFDFRSIAFALRINRQQGRIVYGGSTISQQLARTLFLSPRRNYLRKYLELALALEVELFLDKERILELYLNYAEWGDGVYGIADGARFHFGRELAQLEPVQWLELLAILPNPRVFTPRNFRQNQTLSRRFASLQAFYRVIREIPPEFTSTIREL